MNRSEYIKNEILKKYKSVRQFAKEAGIPYTTLKSALQKENGIGNMAIENALKIFNTLGIDINSMSDTSHENKLSNSEELLISNYRKLSPFNQETINLLIERLIEGCKSIIRFIPVPVFDLPASAGTGAFLDSDRYELVDFPEEVVPRDSNFAVKVSGDSMEPDYPDGSVAFVKKAKEIEPGDVGIFIVNNEGFIKKLGNSNNLISINPKYKDISISEYDYCKLVGKVVGKYSEK